MRWMSIHFPKWQACHWKLGGENQDNFLEVYIASERIYPHPGSEKVPRGMCVALELRSPLNMLDGAGSWGKPWGEQAADMVISQLHKAPGKVALTSVFQWVYSGHHITASQLTVPWQGSTNNNWTTANVITSHSPFPAGLGTQSFNPTGQKGHSSPSVNTIKTCHSTSN